MSVCDKVTAYFRRLKEWWWPKKECKCKCDCEKTYKMWSYYKRE